jgi:hypothetical protein
MRFGRVILLAGLAPLLSLSAVASILVSAPAEQPGKRSWGELLRSAVVLAVPEAPVLAAPAVKASPQAVLAIEALAATPLRHSLWMLAPAAGASLPARAPLRSPLRC